MRTIMIAGLAILIAACGGSEQPSAGMSNEEVAAGVEDMLQGWAATGSEGRWSDLNAFYATDPGFRWIELGRVAYTSADEIENGLNTLGQINASMSSRIDNVSVAPLGPGAAAFTANLAVDFTSDQFSYAFDGVISGVAVNKDGAWKFLQGHISAPPQNEAAEE